jgi:putative transposase
MFFMRGKLFFIPYIIWHITHRCHNRDFLLKFIKDKSRWLHWLFQAKKKYRLKILNYAVTSNHIHLLVFADGRRWIIPRSIQLIASRTAREYNQRKGRSGAFWDDNYHATAIERKEHLHQCMAYIDLNMVRAGVVSHPSEWPFCGYYELIRNPKRYTLLDLEIVMELNEMREVAKFKKFYFEYIESKLASKRICRDTKWTESIAVGTEAFTKKIINQLGSRAQYRKIHQIQGSWVIRNGFS